jgi:hypothetical protein
MSRLPPHPEKGVARGNWAGISSALYVTSWVGRLSRSVLDDFST